jgi:hypothetical protein
VIYFKALSAFFRDKAPAKDKVKSLFWFAKKYAWIRSLHREFERKRMVSVLADHGYLYYLFKRMYVFLHKDSRQTLIDTDNHSLIPSIVEHYRILSAHLAEQEIRNLTADGVCIFQTVFDGGMQVEIRLLNIHRNRREGLSSIGLWVDGQPIYYLNFLLTEKAVYVAGVQGGKDTLVVGREFTHKTQGIPPHKYLFIGFAQLMHCWGIQEVLGVRHEQHVFQGEEKTRYKLDNFDYNAFWSELLEAEPYDEYWYRIALPLERKDLSELNAKKRGKLKKRYPFMDELEKGIRERAVHG